MGPASRSSASTNAVPQTVSTQPGTGKEIGATLGNNRELFMGAYHAPHVTGEALKTAVFASALFEQLGFDSLVVVLVAGLA